MFATSKPLAEEVSREIGRLRKTLGARQLIKQHGRDRARSEQARDAEDSAAAGSDSDSLADGAGKAAEFSLLWPDNSQQDTFWLPANSEQDLDLATTLAGLVLNPQEEQIEKAQAVLVQMCRDPEAIRFRQDILVDLLQQPRLAEGLQELVPLVNQLGFYSKPNRDMVELYQVTWWLGELESYAECIQAAGRAFDQVEGELRSDGLQRLRQYVQDTEQDPVFRRLVAEMPELLAKMRGVLSVTIGVNLDPELRPVQATLVSVNDERFVEAPLLKLLFGGAGEYEGVMPLHTVQGSGSVRSRANPLMVPLFRDLSRALEQVSKPVGQALQQYVNLNQGLLLSLGEELTFYLGATNLIKRIQAAGLPMCRPELAPAEERLCQVEDNHNLNLALQKLSSGRGQNLAQDVVVNDVRLDEQGRIIILTGPNRGGKTTFMQAVGLTQVLAQTGLHVPGSRARISPVDGIYTHFPSEEELARGTGRFGEEARRLKEVFAQATRHSLVLLNESLSSTHPGESLYLVRDVMRVCRRLGTRLIFVTHLHELAAQVEELNSKTPGDSRCISLVSSMIDPEALEQSDGQTALKRTYKVKEGPPMGRSYALELARSYGISYEQLVEMLGERGALDPAQMQD